MNVVGNIFEKKTKNQKNIKQKKNPKKPTTRHFKSFTIVCFATANTIFFFPNKLLVDIFKNNCF